MRINLPSGTTIVVEEAANFPALIAKAEEIEAKAHEDVKELKRLAKQMKQWPVAEPEKGAS